MGTQRTGCGRDPQEHSGSGSAPPLPPVPGGLVVPLRRGAAGSTQRATLEGAPMAEKWGKARRASTSEEARQQVGRAAATLMGSRFAGWHQLVRPAPLASHNSGAAPRLRPLLPQAR